MNKISPQFVGVELYFDELAEARRFYAKVLGLSIFESSRDTTASSIVVPASFA